MNIEDIVKEYTSELQSLRLIVGDIDLNNQVGLVTLVVAFELHRKLASLEERLDVRINKLRDELNGPIADEFRM